MSCATSVHILLIIFKYHLQPQHLKYICVKVLAYIAEFVNLHHKANTEGQGRTRRSGQHGQKTFEAFKSIKSIGDWRYHFRVVMRFWAYHAYHSYCKIQNVDLLNLVKSAGNTDISDHQIHLYADTITLIPAAIATILSIHLFSKLCMQLRNIHTIMR